MGHKYTIEPRFCQSTIQPSERIHVETQIETTDTEQTNAHWHKRESMHIYTVNSIHARLGSIMGYDFVRRMVSSTQIIWVNTVKHILLPEFLWFLPNQQKKNGGNLFAMMKGSGWLVLQYSTRNMCCSVYPKNITDNVYRGAVYVSGAYWIRLSV